MFKKNFVLPLLVTALISTISFTTNAQATPTLAIGDTGPGGGTVFLTPSSAGNSTGNYFEVAPVSGDSFAVGKEWCSTISSTWSHLLSTGTAIGSGSANTNAMYAYCGAGASAFAISYINNGKNDWFIPSKDEMSALWSNYGITHPLLFPATDYYLSSSESSATNYWAMCFYCGYDPDGNMDNYAKIPGSFWPIYVHLIREFTSAEIPAPTPTPTATTTPTFQPSYFTRLTYPTISLSKDLVTCTAGSYNFSYHGNGEGLAEPTKQVVDLLQDGKVVKTTESLAVHVSFARNELATGSTYTCRQTISQKDATESFTTVNFSIQNRSNQELRVEKNAARVQYWNSLRVGMDARHASIDELIRSHAEQRDSRITLPGLKVLSAVQAMKLITISWHDTQSSVLEARKVAEQEAIIRQRQILEKAGISVVL